MTVSKELELKIAGIVDEHGGEMDLGECAEVLSQRARAVVPVDEARRTVYDAVYWSPDMGIVGSDDKRVILR